MIISKQCPKSPLSLRLFFLCTSHRARVNARINILLKSPDYSSFAYTLLILHPPIMRLTTPLLPSLFLLPHLTLSTLVYSTLTSTVSSPLPSATSSPEWTSPPLFISTLLNTTNTYRSLTSASALIWNTTLATYASSYASQCLFKHSGGPYGENLAEGYANVSEAVGAWGEERKGYKHGEGFSESTGHWTQLVWGGTTSVG